MNKKGVYALLIVVLVVVAGSLALLATTDDSNLLTGQAVLAPADDKTYYDCINVEAKKLTEYDNVDAYCKCKAEEKKGCDLYLKKKNTNKCDAGYLPEYQCDINSKQLPTLYQKYQHADCKTKYIPVKYCETACDGNKCADELCKEKDSGNDPYTGASIKGKNKFGKMVEFTDRCTSADTVLEFYCKNDEVASISTQCSFGCDNEKSQCIIAECTDSDDGLAIYKKGTTSGAVFGETADVKSVKDDTCVNDKQLREYYCHKTGAVSSDVIDCTYGCSESRCNMPLTNN